jgi:hypothetical protein
MGSLPWPAPATTRTELSGPPCVEPIDEERARLTVNIAGPRGALRAVAHGRYDELVLVPAAARGAWLLRRRPDYSGDGVLEFYGIDAGRWRAYLDGLDGPSAAEVVDIDEGGLAVARFVTEAASAPCDLVVLRAGQPLAARATVMASYASGFAVLLPWRGSEDGACTLPAPFGLPDRVAVRVHPDGPRVTMGAAGPLRTAARRALLDLGIGTRRIVCQRAEHAEPPSRAYRLAWSGPVVGLRLSCLRACEATYPPCAHTMASGRDGGPLVVDSVGRGDHLIGVGGQGVGAYTLWRVAPVEDEECHIALVPPARDACPIDRGDMMPWSAGRAPPPGQAVVLVINRSTVRTAEVRLGTAGPCPVPAGEMRAFAARVPVLARATVFEGAAALDECMACLEAGDLLTVEYD